VCHKARRRSFKRPIWNTLMIWSLSDSRQASSWNPQSTNDRRTSQHPRRSAASIACDHTVSYAINTHQLNGLSTVGRFWSIVMQLLSNATAEYRKNWQRWRNLLLLVSQSLNGFIQNYWYGEICFPCINMHQTYLSPGHIVETVSALQTYSWIAEGQESV